VRVATHSIVSVKDKDIHRALAEYDKRSHFGVFVVSQAATRLPFQQDTLGRIVGYLTNPQKTSARSGTRSNERTSRTSARACQKPGLVDRKDDSGPSVRVSHEVRESRVANGNRHNLASSITTTDADACHGAEAAWPNRAPTSRPRDGAAVDASSHISEMTTAP